MHRAQNYFKEKEYLDAMHHIIQAERECGFIHKGEKIVGIIEFYLPYKSNDFEAEDSIAGPVHEVDDDDFWEALEESGILEERYDLTSAGTTTVQVPPSITARPPRPPKPTETADISTAEGAQTQEEKACLDTLFG